MINIIMYHYIRNNEDFNYNCFCRREKEFEAQVELFLKYPIINPFDLEQIDYYLNNTSENAYLLTFDDGYKDHYYCSQYLKSNNIKGIFFPPTNVIKGELLDVNGIHFLIGQENIDYKVLLDYIVSKINKNNYLVTKDNREIDIKIYLQQKLKDRYNSESEIIFIKKLLQKDIHDSKNRQKIICDAIKFFTKFDPKNLVKDLYLSNTEIKQMKNSGMLFGSHGVTHKWLDTLSYEDQYFEINESFSFLIKKEILNKSHPKFLCYPYGAYNEETLLINKKLNINFAVTTEVGPALITQKRTSHQLKRWNTNDCWNKKWNKPILPKEK